MYRLFVAIDFPAWINEQLRGICFGLPRVRWVTENQMHLTLRFIGEVDGGVFRDVQEALQSIEAEPFSVTLQGLGFFPPRRKPEILWVGVAGNPVLVHLRNKVESTLVRSGLTPEGRKFSAHVRIATIKDTPAGRLAQYLAVNNLFKTDPFTVDRFSLYSSYLASEGAIHSQEAVYELRGRRNLKE